MEKSNWQITKKPAENMEYECLWMSSIRKFCKITRFYQAKREDDENFVL